MTAAEDQGGAEGAAADGAPGPASQGAGAGAGAGGADGFSGLSAINRRRKRLAWVQAETNELKKLHEKHGNQVSRIAVAVVGGMGRAGPMAHRMALQVLPGGPVRPAHASVEHILVCAVA